MEKLKPEIKEKTLDALIILNTCIRNMRLYPTTSSKVISDVERLHVALLDILKDNDLLTFEKSTEGVLLQGKVLDESEAGKWQVNALSKILLDFDIRNISFDKGLEKGELTSLLEALSKRPLDLKNEGGLQKILQQKNISHILLNKEKSEKEVETKKEQQLLSPDNISENKIIQSSIRAKSEEDEIADEIRKVTTNPDYLLQAFQERLTELTGKKDEPSNPDQISESIYGMITLIDKVSKGFENREKTKISQEIGKNILTLKSDIAGQLKEKNLSLFFNGSLVKYLSAQETPPTEEKAVGKETTKEEAPDFTPPVAVTQQDTDKAVTKDEPPRQEAAAQEAAMTPASFPVMEQDKQKTAKKDKSEQQSPIAQLKERLRSLPRNDQQAFLDEPLMQALPEIFKQLDAQKDHQAMALVISRLIGNLFSRSDEVRLSASTALNAIFDNLAQDRRIKLLESLSGRLIEWIKEETLSTLPYKSICNHLKILIQELIRKARFAEAIPILEVFSSINAGILEKNEKAYEISRDIIRALASKENLELLFTAFNSTNPARQTEAGSILARLGDDAMNPMLDVLREKNDSDERVRIMKLFIGSGKRAAPVVRDRITKPAPWYYLRNLAYILGHIGDESTAAALQPLLLNENKRLRLEALKSIYRTGGKERGPLLLDTLPQVEDRFKIDIIQALGNAKSVEAVPELIKILKKRKSVAPALREKLEETICTALGSIGSTEALPLLAKISKSGFFSFGRYSNEVKMAAGLAAVSIRKKQENMAKEEKETKAPDQTQEGTIAEIAGTLDDIDISK